MVADEEQRAIVEDAPPTPAGPRRRILGFHGQGLGPTGSTHLVVAHEEQRAVVGDAPQTLLDRAAGFWGFTGQGLGPMGRTHLVVAHEEQRAVVGDAPQTLLDRAAGRAREEDGADQPPDGGHVRPVRSRAHTPDDLWVAQTLNDTLCRHSGASDLCWRGCV